MKTEADSCAALTCTQSFINNFLTLQYKAFLNIQPFFLMIVVLTLMTRNLDPGGAYLLDRGLDDEV